MLNMEVVGQARKPKQHKILHITFSIGVPGTWMSLTNSQVEVCPKKCLSSISCCQQAPSLTIPTCPLVSVSTVEDLAGRKRSTTRPPGLFTDNCSRVNTEGVGQQHLRVCLSDENLYFTFHNMLLLLPLIHFVPSLSFVEAKRAFTNFI